MDRRSHQEIAGEPDGWLAPTSGVRGSWFAATGLDCVARSARPALLLPRFGLSREGSRARAYIARVPVVWNRREHAERSAAQLRCRTYTRRRISRSIR